MNSSETSNEYQTLTSRREPTWRLKYLQDGDLFLLLQQVQRFIECRPHLLFHLKCSWAVPRRNSKGPKKSPEQYSQEQESCLEDYTITFNVHTMTYSMLPCTSLIIRLKGKQAQLLMAVMSAVIIKTSVFVSKIPVECNVCMDMESQMAQSHI